MEHTKCHQPNGIRGYDTTAHLWYLVVTFWLLMSYTHFPRKLPTLYEFPRPEPSGHFWAPHQLSRFWMDIDSYRLDTFPHFPIIPSFSYTASSREDVMEEYRSFYFQSSRIPDYQNRIYPFLNQPIISPYYLLKGKPIEQALPTR